MSRGLMIVSFVLASLLSLALHVALYSPISPLPLSLPSPPSNLTPNNLLQRVEKLGDGKLVGPEDVWVGPEGTLYTATRDGWIKRVHQNGSVEDWKFIGGPALLGITGSRDGTLLVCDVDKGLLKVGEEGVTTLATHVDDGSKIRFRCLKYWLKGEHKGESEIFIHNLPGWPDNIILAPDGYFWIALLQVRSGVLDNLIHRSPTAKRAIAAFPKLLKMMNPMKKGAMATKVAANGTIVRTVDDSNGSVMSFVTSALEFDGHLYLGSVATDFIGKLPL